MCPLKVLKRFVENLDIFSPSISSQLDLCEKNRQKSQRFTELVYQKALFSRKMEEPTNSV